MPMTLPKDLTGHIHEILESEYPTGDASRAEIRARSRPLARDGFTFFVYSILLLAVLGEAVSIAWMDRL